MLGQMLRSSRILSLLFFLLGGTLAIYGWSTAGDPMYQVSLGKNINLIWGSVLLISAFLFGLASLLWEREA